jgi:hypothetical protein
MKRELNYTQKDKLISVAAEKCGVDYIIGELPQHKDLNVLMDAAVKHWDSGDMLDELERISGNADKLDLGDWAASYLSHRGYIIIKPQTLAQEEKISEFMDTLYPYYNERQAALF